MPHSWTDAARSADDERHARAGRMALAILFTLALLAGGGVAIWVASVQPVHEDPATIRSVAAAQLSAAYVGPVEESRDSLAPFSSQKTCRASQWRSPWTATSSGPKALDGPMSIGERR